VRVEMRHAVTRKARAQKIRRVIVDGAVVAPDAQLLDKLKAWRYTEAQAQSVPAYVIFHDRTLAGIAAAQPQTLDQLAAISGIGAKKGERYGAAILALLQGAQN